MVNTGLIRFVDRAIGSPLCLLLSMLSRKREIELKKSKRILFIQLWGIGETILTLPAVGSIKRKFKDSQVYVLATDRNKEVYLSSLDVNVLTTKLSIFSLLRLIAYNFRKFDIVIDMEEYLNISSLLSFFLGKQRIGYSHGARSRIYNLRVDYNDKQHALKTFLDLAKPLGAKEERIVKLKYSEKDKKSYHRQWPCVQGADAEDGSGYFKAEEDSRTS